MSVMVDTNVIADVLYHDPVWEVWSQEQMLEHAEQLLINPFIYAELCYRAASVDEVEQLVEKFKLQYLELPREALYLAAKAYSIYRQRGGAKTSPLADFFIGAHAQVLGIRILTRYKSRYRTYFPDVTLICPE